MEINIVKRAVFIDRLFQRKCIWCTVYRANQFTTSIRYYSRQGSQIAEIYCRLQNFHNKMKLLVFSAQLLVLVNWVMAQPTFLPKNDPAPDGMRWESVKNMSDEFDGIALDTSKWFSNPKLHGWGWIGRPPGLFLEESVNMNDGKMCVTVAMLDKPETHSQKVYKYRGAAIRAVHAAQPGMYFECRMKANQTEMSSTFWLMAKDNCEKRMEIDIQECVGVTTEKTAPWAKNWDRIFHSNLINHVTQCTPEKLQVQGATQLDEKNSSRFFVYGGWWKSPDEFQFFLDGKCHSTFC